MPLRHISPISAVPRDFPWLVGYLQQNQIYMGWAHHINQYREFWGLKQGGLGKATGQ